ncbi:hypothetical protein EN833_29665 [Mesorhizobium sp. M4B.F.Ca.ET.190.01.1.1]|nr:hypothetical protein EN833_29665 [Mesorhizobium sp. M4B.F.Ca.ET.190.01.1.1]
MVSVRGRVSPAETVWFTDDCEKFWEGGAGRGQQVSFDVGAAPHPPAGTFSPYSDGEKGGSWPLRWGNFAMRCAQRLSPVTIRGEMPGRA